MASIRVNTGLKVEVNDNGDFIVVPIEDNGFLDRFYKLVEVADKIGDEVDSININDEDHVKDTIDFIREKSIELMNALDELFGENSCKKIFGDIVPSGYAFADFFGQLIPVINEYRDNKEKELSSRYSKNRKGGR